MVASKLVGPAMNSLGFWCVDATDDLVKLTKESHSRSDTRVTRRGAPSRRSGCPPV